MFAGIEGKRIGPDGAESLADFRLSQILEINAMVLGVGKTEVGAAGASELAVELDDVTDITDDEERRTALMGREVVNVGEGLVVGFFEGDVPLFAPSDTVSGFRFWGMIEEGLEGIFFFFRESALFGFEDKGTLFVEVGIDGGGGSVGFVPSYGTFEDIGVMGIVCVRGIGTGNADEVGEFAEEHLIVGAFSGFGFFPAGDKGFDFLRCFAIGGHAPYLGL